MRSSSTRSSRIRPSTRRRPAPTMIRQDCARQGHPWRDYELADGTIYIGRPLAIPASSLLRGHWRQGPPECVIASGNRRLKHGPASRERRRGPETSLAKGRTFLPHLLVFVRSWHQPSLFKGRNSRCELMPSLTALSSPRHPFRISLTCSENIYISYRHEGRPTIDALTLKQQSQ